MPFLLKAMINGIKFVLMVLMALMVFVVGWGVFTRYILNDADVWTGELAGYVLVWITFLGGAWAIFEKSHIGFETLVEKFPRPIYIAIQLLFHLCMLVFVGLMTYYGYFLTINAIHDDTMTLPISKGVVYAVLPISGVVMIIGFIMEIGRLFMHKKPQSHASETASNTVSATE